MPMYMFVKNFHGKKIFGCFRLPFAKDIFRDIIFGTNLVQWKLLVMMRNIIVIYKWLKIIKNRINKQQNN